MDIAGLIVSIFGAMISLLPILFGNIQFLNKKSRAESLHKRLLKMRDASQHKRYAEMIFGKGKAAEKKRLEAAVEWAENASIILPFVVAKIVMRTLIACGVYISVVVPLILWDRVGSLLPSIPSIEWHDLLGVLIAFVVLAFLYKPQYFVVQKERQLLKQVYGVFNAYYELVISRSIETLNYDYERFFSMFDIYMKMEFEHAKELVAEFRKASRRAASPQLPAAPHGYIQGAGI